MNEPNSVPRFSGWQMRTRERRAILVLGDLIMGYLALSGALYLWSLRDAWALTFFSERVETWFYFLPLAWILLLVNLYDPHRVNNLGVTLRGILASALLGLVLYAFAYFLVEGNQTRIGVGLFLALAAVLTLLWRLLYIRIFTAPALMRRVLVLGAGRAGETLLEAYHSLNPRPFYLVGFVDDDPEKIGRQLYGYPILAAGVDLWQVVERYGVSELIIAVSGEMQGRTFQAVLDAQERGLDVTPMTNVYEELMGRVPIHHLESEWLIRSFVIEARASMFYEAAKRLLDIAFSLVGLVALAVMYPFVAVGILLESGRPVFYHQIRLGKGGRPYRVAKFRTMRQDAEKDGVRLTVENDERVTRFGSFLRRAHLDEFPQFWNVLKGEMSIVGPRAERPEWVAQFEKQIPFYRARLLVKPGITGWAQVNYAYYVTVEEMAVKLEYDLYYIKHRSLLMDLAIILRTIWQVFGMRGR
ncbi:MAG: sugar transferase [Anaerolineales bacterium]|nr:sugar transferase [Anaerolineales bacterium]MCX7608605.1 sugar transferase [Anaerolineales bacterium]MDW8227798.1 sugar transferase [Anaerolineales bacterium]